MLCELQWRRPMTSEWRRCDVSDAVTTGSRCASEHVHWERHPHVLQPACVHWLLSVQCNALHGTEYKITCGVCACLCVCVCVCVCVRTGFGGQISRKRLEIEVWLQWGTNRKWHMADRLVTWPMTSRDLERSRSWPRYEKCQSSWKWLEIETRLQ